MCTLLNVQQLNINKHMFSVLILQPGRNVRQKLNDLFSISNYVMMLVFNFELHKSALWMAHHFKVKVKVKLCRYRPGVAQTVGWGITLLFHDRGTRRGWVVSSTSRRHFTPGKNPIPILQETGWASGPVWTGGKSRPHRDSIPDRSARSQSLYRLNYPAQTSL